MGKEKLQEKALRQVNIVTEDTTAVSESINVGPKSLIQTEDQIAGISITSPVMKKVNAIPLVIPAEAPAEQEVITAHNEVGLKLSPSSVKHPKRVQRAAEKRALQRELVQKKDEPIPAPQGNAFAILEALDIEKLMYDKSGGNYYEKLVRHYRPVKMVLSYIPGYEAAIKTRLSAANLSDDDKDMLLHSQAKLKALYDVRAFYDVYERLMVNKYFAMLPHKDMHALSYKELRIRLDKLYNAAGRNQELINYYQDLIRLKELDLEDGKSASARVTEYYDASKKEEADAEERDPKEELGKMAGAYAKLEDYLKGSSLLSAETAKRYKHKMFETFASDIDKFRQEVPKPKGDLLKLLQDYDVYKTSGDVPSDDLHRIMEEGRPEDEKILQRRDSASVNGIELNDEQKEGVRLIGAWILRHSLTDFTKHASFAFNLMETSPEQQLIMFYLVENGKQESAMGIDFFSALHNYSPNLEKFKENAGWENISRAARTSITLFGEMEKYGKLSEEIREADDQVRTDEDENAADEKRTLLDKRNTVVLAMARRGAMLRMLYRNAGLHEDMPPDMAEDPVLRKKMFQEYRELGALITKLDDYNRKINDHAVLNPSYDSEHVREDKDRIEGKDANRLESAKQVAGYINEFLGHYFAEGADHLVELADGVGEMAGVHIVETAGYRQASGYSLGLSALLGFIGATVTSISIAMEHGITVADRTAQALSVSADYLNASGTALESAASIATYFNAISTVGATSLTVAGGAAAGIAGAIKIASSGIQMGRAISSRHDVARSREALENATEDRELTKDEKQLKRFLSHEDREITRHEKSAGIGIATGVMAVASGSLLAAGMVPAAAGLGLLCLGVEVFSKIWNRKGRNKNRRQAVDDLLKTDELVDRILAEHPEKERLRNIDREKLKDMVREEAVSKMGFSSYHECFRHICTEFASMLYDKVFIDRDGGMYLDAMRSLGMKIRYPQTEGDEPKPSVSAMVKRMMAG